MYKNQILDTETYVTYRSTCKQFLWLYAFSGSYRLTTKASSGSINVSNPWQCLTLDNPHCPFYDLQELQHQSLEQSHKLKVRTITCLGLDVFLELSDISVNETGRSIQTVALSWLGALLLTRSSTIITKQRSRAEVSRKKKDPWFINSISRAFQNTITGIRITDMTCKGTYTHTHG